MLIALLVGPARSGADLAGAAVVLLLLLGGALWCIALARRPGASAPCAYGLMLVLLGVFVSGGALLLQETFPAGAFSPDRASPAMVVPALRGLALTLVLAGGLFAAVGIVVHGRHPGHPSALLQAVLALAVTGFALVFAVSFAVKALFERLGGAGAGPHGGTLTSGSAAPAAPRPILREDLNLHFRTPPRPWVEWDAKKLNPDVTFGVMRSDPTIHLMVIAEKSDSSALQTAGLAETARTHLRSKTSESTFGEERATPINGLEGVRFTADTKKDRKSMSYVFWVCSRGGFLYQAIAFAEAKDRAALHREADSLFARLGQIDLERDVTAKPRGPLPAFRSDDLGLALDVTGKGWMEWRNLAQDHPEVAVGGTREDDGGFLLTPFLLEVPTPNPEAVASAVLKEWDVTWPSPAITLVRKEREAEGTALTFRLQRKLGQTEYAYRMKVFVGKGRGVFLAAWSRPGMPALEGWMADLVRGLRLSPPRSGLTVAALPDGPRLYHARFHNRIGLYHYTAKDYRTAVPHFEAAVRLDPKDKVYLTNALDALNRDSRFREGLLVLGSADGHPARRDDAVRAWEAWFLKKDGQRDRSLAVYRQLFAGAFHEDEDFKEYADLLAEAGRYDQMVSAFDRYLAKAPSSEMRLEEARLLGKGKKHAEALQVLERLQKTMPPSAEVSFARLSHHRALGQHRQRVALCDELIRSGLASADAYYEKGDAEADLKWYRRSKASLEEALKLAPEDEDTREYLQYVSGLLGEGNNSSVKEAVPAVPLPALLTERTASLKPPAGPGDFGATYVYWTEGYALDPKGELRTTVRQRIHVADQAGVEQWSTVEIDWNPLGETVYVNELLVRDLAGRVVGRGQPSDYYVIDRQKGDSASHDKTLYVPVPSLAPGHLLDLTYTRRETVSEFPFAAISLSAERPVQLRAAYVLGDTGRLRHRATLGMKAEPIPGGLLWRNENPPAYPLEPSRVSPQRAAPGVFIAGAAAEWPALARDYLERIQPQLVASSEVQALSRRLVTGQATRQQKIDVLVKHVQGGYVYKPIEFGRRARTPNPAAQTVGKKYGDCKDLSVLLHGLLGAAGVESRLVLAHTREPLQKDLPSIDQFNHMIVLVPDPAGGAGRFYDPTDKWLSVRAHPPVALAAAEVLVLDPVRPRLETLPAYAADSSTVSVARKVRVDRDRSLLVTETLSLGGYYAASLRDHLTTLDPRRQRQWAQGVVSEVGRGAQLDAFAAKDVRDAEKPLVVELTYRLPERCSASGSALRCTLPASWEGYYLGITPLPERRTPFHVDYPLRVTSATAIEGPDGCGSFELEALAPATPGEFMKWTSSPTVERGIARLDLDATLRTGTYPAARYPDYFRQAEQAIRSVSRSVTCGAPPAAQR